MIDRRNMSERRASARSGLSISDPDMQSRSRLVLDFRFAEQALEHIPGVGNANGMGQRPRAAASF
jgi:hypothetical protein